MLYDKGFLSDDLARESIDCLEDYVGFLFQALCETAVEISQLIKKRERVWGQVHLNRRTAVSFNGIHFDSRVILGNDRAIDRFGRISRDGLWFNNYDILLEYIRSRCNYNTIRQAEARLGDKTNHDGPFGLDGLAEGTLGLNKIGHGAKAPELYKDGKYEDLLAYNLQDVRLTRKLFEFVRFYHYLTDPLGRAIKIPIDYID